VSRGRVALLLFGFVWIASTVTVAVRRFGGEVPPTHDPATASFVLPVAAVESGRRTAESVFFAYRDLGPRGAPVVVLLHGSPGSLQDFTALGEDLAAERRVIVPDLPGFGRSQKRIPDYSAQAHADYLAQLLDSLSIERAHLVGFSMGGAVALEFAEASRSRIASISLISALGVEELELFGDHRLNHALHVGQSAIIRTLDIVLPHFGLFDDFVLGVSYARNFVDTDQRRLRGILERYDGPMRIVHGEADRLVPYAAALEHHRIVPQSDLVTLPGDHFLLWTAPRETAAALRGFFESVELGLATTRSDADSTRVEAAKSPFDASMLPPPGIAAEVVLAALLALATLVSEDLACIGGGLLVAQGRLSAVAAVTGCFLGILLGDVLLFLVGRVFLKPVLQGASGDRTRFVSRDALERGSTLLLRHGPKAILLSRFTPGLRLPTYLAAGALGMPLMRFTLWFCIAGLLWTPALVLLSARFGGAIEGLLGDLAGFGALAVFAALVIVYCVWRLVVSLLTRRGRRLLRGRIERWRRYEFWPAWAFYPPVAWRLLRLSWQHRRVGGFRVVTAVNPGIETSGFVGESKSAILEGLSGAGDRVARYLVLRVVSPPAARLEAITRFRAERGISLPLVLKPDVGQRGSGVSILRDEASLERFVTLEMTVDHVVQEYVPGVEYGIFWIRLPGQHRGRIFSVTEKKMPVLVGDGRRTLEELILEDDRAVCLAEGYFERNSARLHTIPAPGEPVQLVELGTHCRGAIFLDGASIVTPALEEWIDEVSRTFDGFHFGRYDLRGASEEHFRRADGIRVIELNGVTSEATHLYDPKHSLREAYAILFEQWNLAFQIGAANVEKGATITSPVDLIRRFLAYRRAQRGHASS